MPFTDLIILMHLLQFYHGDSLVRQRVDQEDFLQILAACNKKWKPALVITMKKLNAPASFIYLYTFPFDLVKIGPT